MYQEAPQKRSNGRLLYSTIHVIAADDRRAIVSFSRGLRVVADRLTSVVIKIFEVCPFSSLSLDCNTWST